MGETIEMYYGSNDGTADTPGEWILQQTVVVLFPEDTYRVGFAITSHHNGYLSEATFDNYSIQEYSFPTSAPSTSSAPTLWMPLVDIGEPNHDGQFSITNGIDYIKGSGTGIWGNADSFSFYNHQVANAPLEMTMYINWFDNNLVYGRGGLMIRDSNDPDAANAFMGAAGNDQGAVFQSRGATGEDTVHHKMMYANNQNKFWVKMTYGGADGVATGYYKIMEEDEWIEVGQTQLSLSSTIIQVGRAITSGNEALHTIQTSSYVLS